MSAPRIVTVVQARKGSSRLPGKVMMPILGEPVLLRQVERIQRAKHIGALVVATTTEEKDDMIEALCARHNLACFRGHSTDLLDRHYQAALRYEADAVVKIPSDCPLIDPAVIDRVIGYYIDHAADVDFVSNLHPATYPDGNDVEIMRMDTLHTAWTEAAREMEREHTTPYIWENAGRFRLANLTWETGLDYSMSHRFTLDYPEDFDFIRRVYEELYPHNPEFTLQDILQLLAAKPEIYEINSKFAGVNWYRHHLDELKTVSKDQTRNV